MASLLSSVPIETILKDDKRVFKLSLYDSLESAFSALQAFVKDSYSLDNERILIQYKDEECDLVTLTNIEDFEEALEFAKNEEIPLTLNIKIQSFKPKQQTNNEQSDEKEDLTNDNIEFGSNFLNDLGNNNEFKNEFISFLQTLLLLLRETSFDASFDVETCVMQALSSHDILMDYPLFRNYFPLLKLPNVANQIKLFSSLLLSIQPSQIEGWVNQAIDRHRGNIGGGGGPFGNGGMMQHLTSLLASAQGSNNNCNNNNNNNNNNNDKGSTDDVPLMSSTIGTEHETRGNDSNNNGKKENDNPNNSAPPFGFDLINLISGLGGGVGGPQSQSQVPRLPAFGGGGGGGFGHFGQLLSALGGQAPLQPPVQASQIDGKVVSDDSSLANGACVLANQILIKTWRIRNISTKSWGNNGLLIKYIGKPFNAMINGASFEITNNNSNVVNINDEIECQVMIVAPKESGIYQSEWSITLANGERLITDKKLIVSIDVINDDINVNNDEIVDSEHSTNVKEMTGETDMQASMISVVNESDQQGEITTDGKDKDVLNDDISALADFVSGLSRVESNDIDMDIDMDVDNTEMKDEMMSLAKSMTQVSSSNDNDGDIDVSSSSSGKDVKKEEENAFVFANEMKSLKEMGFGEQNEALLKGLLVANEGNLDKVINLLSYS